MAANEIEKFLSSIDPFKTLIPQELSSLVSVSKLKTFKKGDTIYNEGEPAEGVWVLYKGRLQVFKFTSDGKSFALESLAPGEVFGTLCRLGSNNRAYPCTAVCAEESRVILIPERIFLDCYSRNGGFVRGLCSLCSERLKDVQGLRCLGQEAVPKRIASVLTRLFQVHGHTIPFTKKELSELVGATLETTFRALKQLEDKKILSSARGKILIHKPELLIDISR